MPLQMEHILEVEEDTLKQKTDLPKTQSTQLQDAQFKFDGAWMPDFDPARIGANNFKTLRNLRYIDGGIEGILGNTEINTDNAISTYVNIENGFQLRSNRTQKTYVLCHCTDGSQGRIYQNRTTVPNQGDFEATHLHADVSTGLKGRFSDAPGGAVAYCNEEETMIWAGDELRCAGVFVTTNTTYSDVDTCLPIEYTKAMNNSLTTTDNTLAYDQAAKPYILLFSTRPLKGFKVDVSSANVTASTMTVKTWNGSTWAAVSSLSDGTASGGISFAQDGDVTFDDTDGTSEPFHFNGLYMYAYEVSLSAGAATLASISLDAAWQDIKDVWDGVYRQPIQCQFYNQSDAGFEDYTLHVNESSTLDTPVGCVISGMTATDKIILVFEEQQAALKFTMLGTLINKNAADMTLKYWDGATYQSLTITDGTQEGTDTMAKSGLVTWTSPSDEEKRNTFGINGYAYELTVSATLSGTEGNNDTVIDIIVGVPAPQPIRPFKFSTLFQNRLMLGAYTRGQEGNRMDYSLTYGADVFNGASSSRDGLQSLYFGGMDDLTCAQSIYNRFGSRIFSILLVCKDNESYILDGSGPTDFKIFPVSSKIGCPAPLTMDSAEVGFEMAKGVSRNVCVWMSYSGPILFDGAILKPIRGIDNFFDQTSGTTINFSAISACRGWVDSTWKEYNLLVPTGNNTVPNLWVVYDLIRKKWYQKDPSTAGYPLSGFRVHDVNGAQYIYAGYDDGKVLRQENGTTWNGTDITQRVETGDFWPSNSIWHQTRLRWLKVVAKRVDEDANMNVYHFPDTSEDFGQELIWADQDNDTTWAKEFDTGNGVDTIFSGATETAVSLSATGQTERLTRSTSPMNKLAWAHGFGFELATNSTNKGFKPVYWGVRWEYARHDLGTEV